MNDSQKTREELITELHELRRENDALKRSCKEFSAGNPVDFTDADNGKIDFREIGQHFEYLFNTSPDAVLVTRLDDGLAVEVNDAFSKLTGYTREETLWTSDLVSRLWKNPGDRNLLVGELSANGFCKNMEGHFLRKDGCVLTGLISAKIIILKGIPHIFSIVRDISERKKSEEALKKSEEKLRELNATKDKFFAIIAHDLKNPFNAILGLSELLKEEVQGLDNHSIVSYTNVIHTTTQQTLKLLENLLDWAGMQHDGFHFDPKRLDLKSLIEYEIKVQEYMVNQKNLTIRFDSKEEIHLTADEKMLSSTLRNLISNAIKFTPRNGKIILEATRKPECVEVSISDNGVGIRLENLGKLFRTETSFTSRGTEDERGTGLGLLLCKEFVERHGGSIWVDSKMGKGSRFTFSIPQSF